MGPKEAGGNCRPMDRCLSWMHDRIGPEGYLWGLSEGDG